MQPIYKKKATKSENFDGNNDDNTVISSEETIVDPICLIAQLSKIRDDFDSVKKIRTYLQKRDPTFQFGDALQLINKVKSQIRESVSHKNLQSFWLIPWFAVLYNNDINHCLSMISPICSLDYNDIHDKNHKKYHETEGEITVVTRESQQPKSRERRSSQSREKEKEKDKTQSYFSDERGMSSGDINLSPLNENEEENVCTKENIIGNSSGDVSVDGIGNPIMFNTINNLEEQQQQQNNDKSNNNNKSTKILAMKKKEASKLRRKYTTVNDSIIDTNKLFGITTVLFLKKMNNKSQKPIIKSSTAKENAAAAASTVVESKAGLQSPQDIINQSAGGASNNNNVNITNDSNESGGTTTKKKAGIFKKFGFKNKDKDKESTPESTGNSNSIISKNTSASTSANVTVGTSANDGNDGNNSGVNERQQSDSGVGGVSGITSIHGRRDSGALLSYNNESKTFVLPQFVSYGALEIIVSMLSIHDFFKLSGVCR